MSPDGQGGRPVRVLGVSASPRAPSVSETGLAVVLDRARAHGCEVTSLRLREMRLPFCNGDKKCTWADHPDVTVLRESFRQADAVVVSTPEYHGGMTGCLKNAFDLLDFEHAEGKVFAAVSSLGGRHNANALNHVRTVVRWFRAWMVPEQVAIPQARTALVNGRLTDPEVVDRLEALADSLVRAAVLLVVRPGAPADELLVVG